MPKSERTLTVYESTKSTNYNQIPRILLEGKWLKELGFEIGQKISLDISTNQEKTMLVIEQVN